jgi:3-dehydroquinate synthase
MEKLVIHGSSNTSLLLIGESIDHLKMYLHERKVIVITDAEVHKLYPSLFEAYETIIIGIGESVKNLNTVSYIYDRLVDDEADRSVFLLGIGGGVVCDITGFVASTYARGIDFGFVPTTLLAQVDAGIGGKNGVNFRGFKNRIGTFNQPEFVLCDFSFFHTLPEKEIRSGLGEVVKNALVADADLFNYLEENVPNILNLQSGTMRRLVTDSLRIKSDIVGLDEKEEGERRKLNFGHTVGHAIEQQSDLTHGEAVSIGIAVVAKLSSCLGLLSPAILVRILNLLHQLKLPVVSPISTEKIIEGLRMDKKREGDVVHIILLDDIGHAIIEEITLDRLKELLSETFMESF